jgi:hypothetical protein
VALSTLWRQVEPVVTALETQAPKKLSILGRWRANIPAWLLLVAIGGAMPLVYGLGIALRYPLSFGLAHPRGTWVIPGEGSPATMVWQIVLYLLLTLLYVAALRTFAPTTTHRPARIQVGFILLIWLLSSLALLFAAPNGESHDIYDYIFRGRMLDRVGASPLEITPNAYPHAHFYRYVAWKRHVDTYGPLWEYTSAAVAGTVRIVLEWAGAFHEQLPSCPQSAAACHLLTAYITGYRLLAILLTGLSALLLYGIVHATYPEYAPLALATWLWNPLLLISTALGAHNDALMLLLFFLAYWLWQRGRWGAGWLVIGLATQVKLTALLLAPVWGLWMVRKLGWLRALGVGVAVAVIMLPISWALYAPLGGWATLPRMVYERQLFVSHSLAQILYFLLYKWSGWPYSLVWTMMVSWSTWLFLAAAVLFSLRAFLRMDRGLRGAKATTELYRSATLLTLLYLLAGSFWFQPWYVVWMLAPAALWVDGRFPRWGLPWLCFGALSSNAVYDHLTQLPLAAEPDAHLYRLGTTVLVVMTIWLPLLIAQTVGAHRRTVQSESAESALEIR